MSFQIGENVNIHPSAQINVTNGFIGDRSIISEGAVIEGHSVNIGHEAYIGPHAVIGGGSCFDECAYLKAGDWLHLGPYSHVNIARGVEIGHENGVGLDAKIFTHGAYTDSYNLGSPTQWGKVILGNNVWLPNAWVNPGVTIGDNTVIVARSLVNKSVASGVLAGGIPCKVIKKNAYPKVLSKDEKKLLVDDIISQVFTRKQNLKQLIKIEFDVDTNLVSLYEGTKKTTFDLKSKQIEGEASDYSEIVKDQLRRNGIRFRYKLNNNTYIKW